MEVPDQIGARFINCHSLMSEIQGTQNKSIMQLYVMSTVQQTIRNETQQVRTKLHCGMP